MLIMTIRFNVATDCEMRVYCELEFLNHILGAKLAEFFILIGEEK